jgi:hypothetical protein
MKGVLTIAGFTLLLVACNQSDPCRPHKDEASCSADKACKWKAEKGRCKTAKKGEKSPQSEKRATPSPSEQAVPSVDPAPSAAPGINSSLPSTETQPQPTYPEGER